MMPNSNPRDLFFYPILTLMIDSYIICELKKKSVRNLEKCSKFRTFTILYGPIVNGGPKTIKYFL